MHARKYCNKGHTDLLISNPTVAELPSEFCGKHNISPTPPFGELKLTEMLLFFATFTEPSIVCQPKTMGAVTQVVTLSVYTYVLTGVPSSGTLINVCRGPKWIVIVCKYGPACGSWAGTCNI